MDEDITIILQKQAEALPSEIRKYVVSGEWEQKITAITQKFNLSEETASVLGREVMLVLAGLVHPGVFRGEFASDINDLDDTTINAIVSEVVSSVFQPILPILEKFFKEQDSTPEPEFEPQKEKEKITIPAPPSLVETQRVWEKKPEVVPDNLPTGEVVIQNIMSIRSENNIPSLTAPLPDEQILNNTQNRDGQTHPFEEKMKKVFTGGMVDRGGLVLDQKSVNDSVLPNILSRRPAHDPYREPIE